MSGSQDSEVGTATGQGDLPYWNSGTLESLRVSRQWLSALSAQGGGIPERTDPRLTWSLLGYGTESLEHWSRLQWLHLKAVPVVTTITFIQSRVVCWQFPHESYMETGLHLLHKYYILKIAWGSCHTVRAAIAATGTKHNAVSTPLLGSQSWSGVQNVHRNNCSYCRQKPCAFCFLVRVASKLCWQGGDRQYKSDLHLSAFFPT